MTEHDVLKRVVLCRPEHFQLLPINDMARRYLGEGRHIEPGACLAEHGELAAAYREHGIEVSYVEPDPALRYQVFTRDPALLAEGGLIMGQLREEARQGEERPLTQAVSGQITLLAALEEYGAYLEGGDVAFLDPGTVAVGVGARTNGPGAAWLGEIMAPCGIEVIRVPFDPAYLHLDIIFAVVAPRTAVAVIDALPEAFLARLRAMKFDIIAVDAGQALDLLACNVVATGREAVVSAAKNGDVNRRLRSLGLKVLDPALDQLLMGGGGPRCLTLPVARGS